MIITIANEQVSSGKSTIAENFAALCAYAGRKVVLVDRTSQKKSYQWSNERGAAGVEQKVPVRAISGKGLELELENLSMRYKDIVIDTEGRDSMASRSALNAARLVIIPVNTHEIDLKWFDVLARRIKAARWFNPQLRVLVVISRADHDVSPDNLNAVKSFVAKISPAILSETVIHEEAALRQAFQEGLSVPESTSPDSRAVVEMLSIYRKYLKMKKSRAKGWSDALSTYDFFCSIHLF